MSSKYVTEEAMFKESRKSLSFQVGRSNFNLFYPLSGMVEKNKIKDILEIRAEMIHLINGD